MNPFLLHFISGNAFFTGMSIASIAMLIFISRPQRILSQVLTILVFVGIIFVLLSATPLPLWVYATWTTLCLLLLVLFNSNRFSFKRRLVAIAIFLFFSSFLWLLELRYHTSPQIAILPSQQIYVIGDSFSAGVESKNRSWPTVLAEVSRLPVVNLAEPGATVKSAHFQVASITRHNSLVFVEIGGNDMLNDADSHAFSIELDALLSQLHGNHIVMFELPLPPFYNEFGRVQRSLAQKYGVSLIPKRYMTEILGLKNGTLDGIHLSPKGHNTLARMIYSLLIVPK